MLSMIDSTSKGLVQSSPAQHHNHMLCTTIDSHSFLPEVLLGDSWAYKGNHVRESQQQSYLTSHPDKVAKGMVNSYPVFLQLPK